MRGKTFRYAIKCNGKYLQGIKPNDHYSRTGTAPTMGVRHSFTEFETVWGEDVCYIEPLTVSNYLKVLFEEYRWNTKNPKDIKLIPIENERI